MSRARRMLQPMQLAALALTLPVALPALAHHSQAAFDTSQVLTFEGTVHRLDWKNPHIYLIVETTDASGASVLQQIEGLAVTQARVDGLERDALAAGTRVVVRANPNRGGAGKTVRGLDVTTTADGKIHPFYQRPPGGLELEPASSLAGNWAPSLAETGKAFAAAAGGWRYTQAGRSGQLVGACELEPVPFLTLINEMRQIVVNDDSVVFRFDNSGDAAQRLVRLDLEQHPTDLAPSLFGHAIGRWEGETLVIDSVGYAPHASGLFSGFPAGAGKHMVERLTLTADRTQLRYDISITDPEYLAEPATHSMLWDHRPDLDFASEPCDPEVSARYREDQAVP
jgi:hypothetical protein